MDAEKNYERLLEILRQKERLAVAFSGGVDSTLLLYAAKQALKERVTALTAVSVFFPEREQAEAAGFCREHGIRQIIVPYDVLAAEGVRKNPKDRCYLCKRALFGKFLELAKGPVAEGSNLDDLTDCRPGLRAIQELGIMSPLRDAQMTKAQIRELSRRFGLPTWSKPSFACLASRFVYGETITEEKLQMVEHSEELLRALGFFQFRVRIHGSGEAAGGEESYLGEAAQVVGALPGEADGKKQPRLRGLTARIEVLPEQFSLLMQEEVRQRVTRELRSLGFTYVAMDLGGYRTGSMNET